MRLTSNLPDSPSTPSPVRGTPIGAGTKVCMDLQGRLIAGDVERVRPPSRRCRGSGAV